MKQTLKNERGLSLVEVTIMLLVLMLLTGVLAPSIFDFVNDAKWVKVKEDCEAIGLSVARLTRDVGPCLKFDASQKCTKDNRVDILYSDGPDVLDDDLMGSGEYFFDGPGTTAMHLNWRKDDLRGDSMEDQFVTNMPLYGTPAPPRQLQRRRPAVQPRLARCVSLLAHRPGPVGPPLPGQLRVPGRRRRRGMGHRRRQEERRLVQRHVLHLGRPQRPL